MTLFWEKLEWYFCWSSSKSFTKILKKITSLSEIVGCRCFSRRVRETWRKWGKVPQVGGNAGRWRLDDFFAKQKLLLFLGQENKSSLKGHPRFCRSQMTFEFFFWVMNFNGLVLQPSRLNKSRSYILPILHTCTRLSSFDASLTWLEVLYLDTIQKLTSPLLPGMRSPSTEKGRHGFWYPLTLS